MDLVALKVFLRWCSHSDFAQGQGLIKADIIDYLIARGNFDHEVSVNDADSHSEEQRRFIGPVWNNLNVAYGLWPK